MILEPSAGKTPLEPWLAQRREALGCNDPRLDRILLASEFAFDEFRRSPEALALLHSAPIIALPEKRHPEFADALRVYRRLHSLKILIDDVLDRDSVDTTLARITELADSLIALAFEAARDELVTRHGEPCDEQGDPQPIVVLGLGKLGSRELNFSSDIDLIASFPAPGETNGRRSIDNEDFFARLVQRASTLLGETRAEGFCYRVDWRLRPYGSAGRLALSFAAMEDYYQREGRDWERFALLRARPVAGDMAAGFALLDRLRPFVWRRYFDYAALEGLRELKSLVDSEVRKNEREADLKLGRGGIREVEFRAQLESIIRGGRDPNLRIGHTIELLDRLAHCGVIESKEHLALVAAYRHLRRLENRVQMWRDEQLHSLPTESFDRQRYAASLGYQSFAELLAELDHHRETVAAAFASCLPRSGETRRDDNAFALRWQAQRYTPDTSETALKRLLDTPAVRSMSARSAARLDRIVPLVLAASDGDDATLERWIDLLAAIAGRTSYLALLAERPATIQRVHRLLKASAWLARTLTESPILLDDLLDARLASQARSIDLKHTLAIEMAAVANADEEHELERLRQFQQSARLEMSLGFLDGRIAADQAMAGFADVADCVVGQCLSFATRDIAKSHGALRGLTPTDGLAVIGYGSLGGRELNVASDLDLVFLYRDELQNSESLGTRSLDGQRYVARVAQRLLHWLTAQTRYGPLYEIDARLRPNGSKGLLVTPASAFLSYQSGEAWLWEHQALVRARFAAGDARLGGEFETLRRQILLARRDADRVNRDVQDMRERWRSALDRSNSEWFDIKQGQGGLVDIEFAAQAALLGGQFETDTPIPTETGKLLRWLSDHGGLALERASTLSKRHAELLDQALRCALALQPRMLRVAPRGSER